eukprot:CAMPEP_0116039804 /NCGR_PEP_ID=MMETSP0321-20121206/23877_1 /TAXON_ID=163516 /ORGANISM="Leptocylindrus danicus var. danicus, Strain B650" /LENGTH=592 /DNA_ID=CAMNT_0003519289 /DNA_START=14 /DNA_END=1792 /DNA_ORIENTATION=-
MADCQPFQSPMTAKKRIRRTANPDHKEPIKGNDLFGAVASPVGLSVSRAVPSTRGGLFDEYGTASNSTYNPVPQNTTAAVAGHNTNPFYLSPIPMPVSKDEGESHALSTPPSSRKKLPPVLPGSSSAFAESPVRNDLLPIMERSPQKLKRNSTRATHINTAPALSHLQSPKWLVTRRSRVVPGSDGSSSSNSAATFAILDDDVDHKLSAKKSLFSRDIIDMDDGNKISPVDVQNFPPPTPFKNRSVMNHINSFGSARSPDTPKLKMKSISRLRKITERTPSSRFETDFEMIDTLGSGSFGMVYRCLSRLDGCMYAIKAAKSECRGKNDRDRMLKEVYALAALSDLPDPATIHVVRYHQAWMEENRLFIQTELCSSNLQQQISGSTPFDEARRFKLLREISLALKLVHANNMVHLDIKPENIFVKNDQFKLGDFGLANQSTTQDEIEEGDSRYMSKELLSGDHSDLTKSDIFSLGATMYEICLGRSLPANGTEWQAIRDGVLRPMLGASIELQHTVRDMMRSEFNERPSAADLLKRRHLMSQEQQALIIERNKVAEANMALTVQHERMRKQHDNLIPHKRGLKRFNTWSIGEN